MNSNPEPASDETVVSIPEQRRPIALKVEQLADGTYRMSHQGDPTLMEVVALAEFAQMMAKYQFSQGLQPIDSSVVADV